MGLEKEIKMAERQAQVESTHTELGCGGYGITGYGVSRPGIQNSKDFCIKTNIPSLLCEVF